jgi:hypothetical protein
MSNYLEKVSAIKEQCRFYINSPEKVAEALLFIKSLEKMTEEVKKSVKDRAVELMEKENVDMLPYSITDFETGEIRDFEIKRNYGSTTKDYLPENVFKVLGDKSFKYFKVAKTAIDRDMKKMSAKREITMIDIDNIVKDAVIKTRKGAGVIMREVKPTK